MFFPQLYEIEYRNYQQIAILLAEYDFSLPPQAQESIFVDIIKVHRNLAFLQAKHAELTHEFLEDKIPLWAATINGTCIPADRKANPLVFLREEYFYFINHLLDLSKIEEADSLVIKSLLLKLISHPKGQELIMKLNRLKRANEKLSLEFHGSDEFKTSGKRDFEASGCTTVKIYYPKNSFEKALLLLPGRDVPLIYNVLFIALGHELVHGCHYFDGTYKNRGIFPSSPAAPLYHLYDRKICADKEEYVTIEDGLCENSLREEHDLPLRGGHICADLTNSNRMIELALLSEMRRGVKEFKSQYFPDNYKLPVFLSAAQIKFPWSDSSASPNSFLSTFLSPTLKLN